MTWTFDCEQLSQGQVQKFSVLADASPLSYATALQLLQTEPSFRNALTEALATSPFPAYFWETPPITQATIQQQPFEFVLVNSPQLATIRPNPSAFHDYFDQPPIFPGIVTFSNLRGDARLVVPCPLSEPNVYPHIAAFVRHAPSQQQHALWQSIGKMVSQQLSCQSLWVSTSGLGVSWLHIRLDAKPKYYSFSAYRKEKAG